MGSLPLSDRTNGVVVDMDERRRETRTRLLEQLFVEHRSDLRAFLAARLGVTDNSNLEDVIQEVFIRLAKAKALPPEVVAGQQKGVSYLLATAHHHVIDMERGNARRRRFMEREAREKKSEIAAELTPEKAAIAAERLEQLKQVIDQMRPKWRRVFVLSRFRFMSYKEIARDMGLSVKQVEKHMQNALICIRRAALEWED